MKKFEYRDAMMTERDNAAEKFAELGKSGWEMVGVVHVEFGIRCFFKRELADG